jgi:ABC-2 type transport system permease protein
MAMTAASVAPGPGSASGAGLASPEWGGFDPSRTEDRGSAAAWRGFQAAVRLGWQVEANWTDPFLFFVYSVAKPVSAALILVVMLQIISGDSDPAYRSFVVVGSALWSLVMAGIAGLAWSVLDDRERYRMLKYTYVSPADFLLHLLGRGVVRVGVGAMGALITIALGILVLGVPFDPASVDWIGLLLVMLLGLVSILAIGVMLAAVCLQTRQESWSYPDAVAGALFLVSGAVFPLAVLPLAVQAIGLANPLTWWIQGVRTAMFPGGVNAIGGPGSLWTDLTGSAAPDLSTTLVVLLVTGSLVTLAGTTIFRISERRARDRGLLDRTTGS